ncbi:hypothetical protein GCM10022276_20990 [Sphingomonas limnosediminicola]|uniref:Uncharacterized protein n=1 Tax=Sphingomonas limnosediminicola TaxID=940133 RepID=A0ABP7LHL3_9SPHN
MNVKIVVRGPDWRQVEHLAEIDAEQDVVRVVAEAMAMFWDFYPDAPPLQKTILIDHA